MTNTVSENRRAEPGGSGRTAANTALIRTLVFGLAITVLLSVAAVGVYVSILGKNGVASFDQPVLNFAMSLRSPGLDSFAIAYTNIASPIGIPIITVIALVIFSLRRRSWMPAILIVAAGSGSLFMTVAGKVFFARARPPIIDAIAPYESTGSFPSGHSLNAVVIGGVVAYLLILRQRRVFSRVLTISAVTIFSITIGLSRVLLGHHWFTDVLAGWLMGAAWLALVVTAHRVYLAARRRHPAGN